MADIILEKSLITAEDIDIGLGKSQQKRGVETVQLTQLNASEVLGMLVIQTVAQLEVLDPENMKVKAVFVQENQTIYTYIDTEWRANNSSVYVIDSITNKQNIPSGYNVAYSIADNKLYYYAGKETWLANNNYVYAVGSSQEVNLLPQGAKMAIAVDTGTLFVNIGGAWNRISLDVNGDPILIVDTVDELPLNVTNILTCIVKDRKRGGIFLYDKANSSIDDGGINFHGWRRQYEGKVSVLWFGADNNGVYDSAGPFTSAFRHGNVIIPAGTYKVAQLVVVEEDLLLEGFGATIEMTNSGSFQFGSVTASTWAQLENITGAGNVFALNSPQLYEYGHYARFKSTLTFSKHYSTQASQLSKLVSRAGLQCYIGDFFKYNYVSAQMQIIKPYRINIKGLTINSNSDNTAIYFMSVCDSVIDNVCISSQKAPCISIKDCANIKFNNIVATVDTSGEFTSMIINGADNIIIDSAIIRGSLHGIQFTTTPSNYIGIYRSVISGDTSVDNNGLTYALNFDDTQLLGKLLVGGYNLKFSNCTMIMPYIYMKGWAGGSCEFLNCSMFGNSQTAKYNFIRVSNNLLFEDNYKLSAPCEYVVRDCSFQGTDFYSGKYFIECIGQANTVNSEDALVSNVIVDGLTLNIDIGTVVGMFGKFGTIKIKSIYSKKQPTALDTRQLYLNNLKSLSSLNLETLVPICDNFYTDLVASKVIVKAANETNKAITKTYTDAEGFLLDQTIPINAIKTIIPSGAEITESGTSTEVTKLSDKDVVKFAMYCSVTVKGA